MNKQHGGDFSRTIKVAVLMVEQGDHLARDFMLTLITKRS